MFAIQLCFSEWAKKNLDKYTIDDFENYYILGQYIFDNYNSPQEIELDFFDKSDENIINIFNKYREDIYCIRIVEEEVIFFGTDALFQSASGVVITKDNVVIKSTYPETSYDGGIYYGKIKENIYTFSAGL